MAEVNQLPVKQERALPKAGFAVLPQTWEQLWSYAKEICNTEFTPKAMRGQPAMVLAAWQKGSEVGLPPMAALESIAVINGVTSLHSDGYWGLVVNHPKTEWFKELAPHEAIEKGYGECTIKRKGNPDAVTRRFTMEMAKTAELLSKDNWRKYPGRMLQQRARHLAADDAVPEATQGLVPSEVAQDYEPLDVTPRDEQPLRRSEPMEGVKDEISGPDTKATENSPQPDEKQDAVGGNDSKDKPKRAKPDQQATEKTQEDWLKEMELWAEAAPEAEILADPNFITANLKALKGTANQVKGLNFLNDRKKAIVKARG